MCFAADLWWACSKMFHHVDCVTWASLEWWQRQHQQQRKQFGIDLRPLHLLRACFGGFCAPNYGLWAFVRACVLECAQIWWDFCIRNIYLLYLHSSGFKSLLILSTCDYNSYQEQESFRFVSFCASVKCAMVVWVLVCGCYVRKHVEYGKWTQCVVDLKTAYSKHGNAKLYIWIKRSKRNIDIQTITTWNYVLWAKTRKRGKK